MAFQIRKRDPTANRLPKPGLMPVKLGRRRVAQRALGQMHSVGAGAAQRARERLGGRKQAADGGQQTAGQQREVQRAEGGGGGDGTGGRRARSGRRVARWDEAGGGGRRLAHPYFVQP
ncbi:hypothetical protein GGX14DRAFT_405751 [Mycena pura]|uniref:Uncharacterized protein n=1 Tax=Mycena pura TaxID=153505 RepID=A0AAD6UVR9_9AGAR|nr:hypothetical protein GGX14DRAFT_405751 [Mycena pura]